LLMEKETYFSLNLFLKNSVSFEMFPHFFFFFFIL
jgi:hypothetical protein